MKNLKIRKKALLVAGMTFVLVFTFIPSRDYNPKYTLNKEYSLSDTSVPFATSRRGDIYIGKEKDMKEVELDVEKDSVIIVDQRNSDDPNIKIQDSAAITDKDEMEEILEVVQEYNELYPSSWERSTEAMMNEWEVHNICSELSVFPSHTDEVDLNNGDEFIYKSKVLTKILDN